VNTHARAVARLTGSSVVTTLTQIAKSKLAAVLLGPSGMGTFNQLKNVWNLGQMLANAGFYSGVVRRVAQLKSESNDDQIRLQVATTSLFLGAFSGLFSITSYLAAPIISSLVFSGDEKFAPEIALLGLSIPFAVFARVYKGVLAGLGEVPSIVRSQIAADLSSVALFVVLVYWQGLWGAVVAFALYHVLKVAWNAYYLCKLVPTSVLLPALSSFSGEELRHNLKFGLNTFVLTPAGMLVTLVVARWIISTGGTEANGVFAAAWMVSSVYLRAIYETASSHYLPVLSSSTDNEALHRNMSGAIRLYMVILTPCVLGLMTLGAFVITLLFSRNFTDAGRLLLFLLPADLLRITSESIGMAYLARQQLKFYAASYFVWIAAYMSFAAYLVDDCGIEGVAIAYLCGQILYVFFHVIAARLLLGYEPDHRTRAIVTQCFLVCLVVAAVSATYESLAVRLATLIVGCLAWWLVVHDEPDVQDGLNAIRRRLPSSKT